MVSNILTGVEIFTHCSFKVTMFCTVPLILPGVKLFSASGSSERATDLLGVQLSKYLSVQLCNVQYSAFISQYTVGQTLVNRSSLRL